LNADPIGKHPLAQMERFEKFIAFGDGSKEIVTCRATCYMFGMIRSFSSRVLKRLYEDDDGSRLPPDMVLRCSLILAKLDVAITPEEMDLPSYRLHPLKGDRKGQWAVTVRANWRIVFRFENGDVHDVDFVDYH
jgi:proteic killer suppression protein